MSSKDGKITTSKVVEVVVTPVSLDMVDSITLTKENNSKAKLEAVVQPEDATHVEIEFTSSNEDVATVNSDGEINAVDVGETTITASIKETDLTAECIVTVAPDIESIELSDTSLKMKKDGTAQLTATANPDGASIDGIALHLMRPMWQPLIKKEMLPLLPMARQRLRLLSVMFLLSVL